MPRQCAPRQSTLLIHKTNSCKLCSAQTTYHSQAEPICHSDTEQTLILLTWLNICHNLVHHLASKVKQNYQKFYNRRHRVNAPPILKTGDNTRLKLCGHKAWLSPATARQQQHIVDRIRTAQCGWYAVLTVSKHPAISAASTTTGCRAS